MPKQYSSRELEKIVGGFKLGTSLSELEKKLSGRTAYGIALKIRKLSKEYPNEWNPQKVADYTRGEIRKHKGDIKAQKKKYRAKQRGENVENGAPVKELQNSNLWLYNPVWNEVTAYLREFLLVYDGNKEQFAEELGIHPSSLSHYLAGRRKPTGNVLGRMLGIFITQCPEDSQYLKRIVYQQNASA